MAQDQVTVNITQEAVFAELQSMIAQQALDLAAERAARKQITSDHQKLQELFDQTASALSALQGGEESGNSEHEGDGAEEGDGDRPDEVRGT